MVGVTKRILNIIKAEELISKGAPIDDVLEALEYWALNRVVEKHVTDRDSDTEGRIIPNDTWEHGYVFSRYKLETGEREE